MMATLINLVKEYKEVMSFLAFVFTGIFVKIYVTMQNGKKFSFKWILAEAIISIFVAVSVWVICDQFLNLNKIATYVICAWAGKSSTVFSEKTEELIETIFESVKAYFKIKISNE